MADTHTREQRSKNMSAVRSRGNRTTEQSLVALLRKSHLTGWRRHLDNLPGKPDFAFRAQKVTVFVDGCFWHGCPKCNLNPKSNKKYWMLKISKNIERDRAVNRELRKLGWTVLRFWEHELKKNPRRAIAKIERVLKSRK